ncbi:MAG TPA: hypothetical protein VMG82_16170 [Candidatus Sulfotelmatobacter sp.]|nr:hypothetical protein [Candidatus Sulfotelmatobacter sp.]
MKTLLLNVAVGFLLLSCTSLPVLAQAQGRMTIMATAKGTSTQLGKLANVNILIESYSTEDDRDTLIAAFKKRGQDGLVDALQGMKPKGRIRFASGGVGNDIKYIMELPAENGRRLRLVTDRWLAFGELYNSTRSADYSVGAIELNLTPDGKGSGTVLPACKLTVNKKKNEIEIETYQNPWNLDNFMIETK